MTDTTTTPAKESKVLTVSNDMTARRVFDSTADAFAYLMKCHHDLSDFGDTPMVRPGMNDSGEFDPAVYTDDMRVMVAKLSNKGAGAKAIVVVPAPKLDALLALHAGREWIQKIIDKELNHVAVRNLRDAEDVSTVADQVPTTIEAYISSGRDAGAGIMEAYNELFKPVNATLSAKVPAWAKARFTKAELRKALESRAYALEWFNAVEDRGEGKDSLLVTALQMFTAAAKQKGLDPTIFGRWLETRNAKTITQTDEAEDLDVDSLMSAMLAEPADDTKTEAEPAA